MAFDELQYLKEKIEKRSRGISQPDINWIRKRLIKERPQWKKLEGEKLERQVLDELSFFLLMIQEDKPADIRAYVEKCFRKEQYDKRLKELEGDIWNLPGGKPKKEYEKWRGKLKKFLNEAESEFPGYTNEKGRRISEVFGDLHALGTGGESGSTRMAIVMAAAKMAEKGGKAKEKRGKGPKSRKI